jgi:uncharacterized protein YdhG (YjbR/CyaY superfamily)
MIGISGISRLFHSEGKLFRTVPIRPVTCPNCVPKPVRWHCRLYLVRIDFFRKKTLMAKPKQTVDQYMDALDHPLKAEVQAIRDIIKAVSPSIKEEVKWNAPSFSYKDYIATFNLRTHQHVHLIFHNPSIATVKSDILEGDYVDRRMTYFTDMNDVKAKQPALEYVVKTLLDIMDK